MKTRKTLSHTELQGEVGKQVHMTNVDRDTFLRVRREIEVGVSLGAPFGYPSESLLIMLRDCRQGERHGVLLSLIHVTCVYLVDDWAIDALNIESLHVHVCCARWVKSFSVCTV